MFSSTPLPRALAIAVVLIGLLATLAEASPAAADDAAVVQLLRHADGRMEVVTGPRFNASGATVIAKETDVVLSTTALSGILDASTGMVTDTLRPDQWNLTAVEAEVAWARTTGSGQVIAVIDSGVDGQHPDLRPRLVPGYSATGANPLVDGHGHGTHVAGTAAASIGDDFGVAGLAPDAGLMSVQVTDATGMAYASDVAEGLIWAVTNGATVANMSLAGTRESAVLNGAIDYALANDVVVVVAAGNEFNRGNPRTYPASHPGVIAVASLRDADTRSSFSSTGDWVDLAAPGSSILSSRPRGTFGYASGTSMAAPLVAGAAALLRSADPTLGVEDVRALLEDHARDLGRRGHDEEYGHGAMDVMSALDVITEAPSVPEIPQVEEPTHQDVAPVLTRDDDLFSAGHFGR